MTFRPIQKTADRRTGAIDCGALRYEWAASNPVPYHRPACAGVRDTYRRQCALSRWPPGGMDDRVPRKWRSRLPTLWAHPARPGAFRSRSLSQTAGRASAARCGEPSAGFACLSATEEGRAGRQDGRRTARRSARRCPSASPLRRPRVIRNNGQRPASSRWWPGRPPGALRRRCRPRPAAPLRLTTRDDAGPLGDVNRLTRTFSQRVVVARRVPSVHSLLHAEVPQAL